jgi:hypothetical protein
VSVHARLCESLQAFDFDNTTQKPSKKSSLFDLRAHLQRPDPGACRCCASPHLVGRCHHLLGLWQVDLSCAMEGRALASTPFILYGMSHALYPVLTQSCIECTASCPSGISEWMMPLPARARCRTVSPLLQFLSTCLERTCCHPLHVARLEQSTLPCAVRVLARPLKDDGDRLKASVWMGLQQSQADSASWLTPLPKLLYMIKTKR